MIYQDAKLNLLEEGTLTIQNMVIARALLGDITGKDGKKEKLLI